MAEERKQKAERTHAVTCEFGSKSTDLQTLNCEELAWRCQQGCRAAFAELIDRYGSRLLQFLNYRTKNVHDAEDLVQDTFVRAYANIHQYRNEWKFSTWLFTIARRLASSHYRRANYARVVDEPVPASMDPFELAAAEENRENIWSLARKLSENQFRALWLRYTEGMSIKQIARVLGKSQVSAKVLLFRARTSLAGRLESSGCCDITTWRQTRTPNETEDQKCSADSTNS